MEDEEIIYVYPVPEQREEVVQTIAENTINVPFRTRIFAICCSFIGIIGIVLVPIIADKSFRNVVLIGSIVLLLIAFTILKTVVKKSLHCTMITAFETYMQLHIYSNGVDFLKEITLNYDDIILCTLSKSYDKATIFYRFNSNDVGYNIVKNNGEIIEKAHTGQITFDINPNSYEQYFFFYVAPKLFEFDMKDWKVFKKYGNERQYIRKNNL